MMNWSVTELFDSIAPRNIEIGTVANPSPLTLKNLASLLMKRLYPQDNFRACLNFSENFYYKKDLP